MPSAHCPRVDRTPTRKKGTLALGLRPPPSPPPAASHLGWRITEYRSPSPSSFVPLFLLPLLLLHLLQSFCPSTPVKLLGLPSLFVTPNHRSCVSVTPTSTGTIQSSQATSRRSQVAGRISPTATATAIARRGCKLGRQGHSHSHAYQASMIPSDTPTAAPHRVSQLPSRPPSPARSTDRSASPRRHLRPGDNPLDFVPGTVPRQ